MSLEVNIQKRFGKFSLDVAFESGEGMTGLLGASGCGKSMTLKCVAGIITPDRGRIAVNGRVLFDAEKRINLPPQQRKVGYLFQHYALFPHMTVVENISAGLVRGEGKERMHQLLHAFQLEGLEEKRPRQLSGGQQQRVALARILASRPETLLLDEPFSALDSYLKWQVELELTEILREFAGPMVLVTHNREEIYRLCGRACVLDHGRSQPVRPVKELFQMPGTLSACLLSGCKNISRARILPDGRVEALDWGVALNVASTAPEGLSHVGIRSHHLRPTEGGQGNEIHCRVAKVTEELFSMTVLLVPQGATEGDARLRLELTREEWAIWKGADQITIAAAPEQLMLLTS